jgi:peptide/nickel transport system permease protein
LTEQTRNSTGIFLVRLGNNRALQSLGRAILVSCGVFVVVFVLMRLIPGDPVLMLLGDQATDEQVTYYRELLGVNGSIGQQFVTYVGRLAHGDLGTSILTGQSVLSTVQRTLPVTLWLIIVTVVMALALAVPLGVLAAVYRRTWFGEAFRVVTSVMLATPLFFAGLVLILVFAIRLGLAPVAGYEPGFPQNLHSLWLPALTLCIAQVPILSRVLQSSIVDTMDQEFVETAIVRGLPRRIQVWRYLLRPSLAPMISLLGYIVAGMLGGAVVVEIVYNLPGIGTALVTEGVILRDYPIVQGITLIFGVIVVGINFLADTFSGWLDPRTTSS